MTSITLTITGAKAKAVVNGPLTSGMVGIPVTINYDGAWDGLTKNLVCRCGLWGPDRGETRTVLDIGETATVAHEVMKADMHLYLGIEGYSADGKLVMPTTWAECGKIQCGANTTADPSANPKLSIWSQLQADLKKIQQHTVTTEQIVAAVGVYLEENPIVPDSSQNTNGLSADLKTAMINYYTHVMPNFDDTNGLTYSCSTVQHRRLHRHSLFLHDENRQPFQGNLWSALTKGVKSNGICYRPQGPEQS